MTEDTNPTPPVSPGATSGQPEAVVEHRTIVESKLCHGHAALCSCNWRSPWQRSIEAARREGDAHEGQGVARLPAYDPAKSADDNALAALVTEGAGRHVLLSERYSIARTILDSDWLAERERKAAARALRKAAELHRPGGLAVWLDMHALQYEPEGASDE